MKSPTGELLHLRNEAPVEPRPSGHTGALELYDELINFLGLSTETKQQTVSHPATTDAVASPESNAPPATQSINPTHETVTESSQPPDQPAAVSNEETPPPKGSANSGVPLPSEDVIKITGPLTGLVASKNANSATVACIDCGRSSDCGEMFCVHCGGLLEEPVVSAEAAIALAELCDDCGAMVESDEIFCPSCGSVMANA